MGTEIQNCKECIKCKEDFVFFPNETYWDESGSSSVKLVKCPYCGTPQALKFGKLHDVNNDDRYYYE